MNTLQLIFTLLGCIFASNGLWSLVQSRLQRRDNTHSTMENGLMALLHDRIYLLTESYIEQGEITVEELDNLKYLFEPYENLGGNGTAKELYERCKRLNIVDMHEN